MSNTLTKDMLATALQRLEALQVGETAALESDELKQRAGEVAEAALQAIAVGLHFKGKFDRQEKANCIQSALIFRQNSPQGARLGVASASR